MHEHNIAAIISLMQCTYLSTICTSLLSYCKVEMQLKVTLGLIMTA